MMDFKKTVLDNGLRIIVAPQKDNPAVTVLVLVSTGSKYETKELNGISHFLEHMVFKGTEKRPKAIDISTELDSIGASYNAFTDFEMTGYYAKVDKDHFDKALDVVSDIYLGQVFDKEEIDKERGPVIEEINMIEDAPMRKIYYRFDGLLYGDQPAGWDIAGPKEVIQKIQREDFLKYKKDHYVASSTVVIVAGAVDAEEATEKIKEIFKDIPTGDKKDKLPVKEEQSSPGLLIEDKDTEQSHLILGVRSYDIEDERKYALNVLAEVLGGGMSSRLFQKVREEMGAAYYVGAGSRELTDHGKFIARAGANNSLLFDVVEAILEEFRRMKVELVEEKELQKAKDHFIGGLMLGLETSDEVAGYYGQQEILVGDLMKPDKLADKIREVTAEDVREVAKDIFQNNKLNLAVIGPSIDEERLKSILKID
ncbi:insulinase family protein [Patescibacteria group bacterium]|nr:insulinase family protein [Patescibacteria group bacterium]